MKRNHAIQILGILFAVLFLSAGTGFAMLVETPVYSYSIADNYRGDYSNVNSGSLHNDYDVISSDQDVEYFNIYGMDVDIYADAMDVDIATGYQGPKYGTDFGDLFISSTGWNPHGDAPYYQDSALNGTLWDYVFDVSEGALYYIGDAQDRIVSSDDVAEVQGWPDRGYRHNQEVLVDTTGLDAVSQWGSVWSGDGTFSMSFDIAGLGLDPETLGFHWGMTCGNDVIEGGNAAAATPEPGTLILLGLGLIGAVGLRRMK